MQRFPTSGESGKESTAEAVTLLVKSGTDVNQKMALPMRQLSKSKERSDDAIGNSEPLKP